MLPVVWTPEANADLGEARAWYDNMRPELGARFALAVEEAVEAIAEAPLQSQSSIVAGGVREFGGFRMESSSRFKSIGLW